MAVYSQLQIIRSSCFGLCLPVTAEQAEQRNIVSGVGSGNGRERAVEAINRKLVPLLIGRPWSLPLRRLVLLLKHGRRIPTRLCTVEIVSRHDPQPCGKARIRTGQGQVQKLLRFAPILFGRGHWLNVTFRNATQISKSTIVPGSRRPRLYPWPQGFQRWPETAKARTTKAMATVAHPGR